jgi:hypothetical protein
MRIVRWSRRRKRGRPELLRRLEQGMKRDSLAGLARSFGARETLTELRNWNKAHQTLGALKYRQSRLDISDEMDVVADRQRYEADRLKDIRLSGTNGIDAAMRSITLMLSCSPVRRQRTSLPERVTRRLCAVRQDAQCARFISRRRLNNNWAFRLPQIP